MTKYLRVAVFPCGSEVGLEIHRSLNYYRHFQLIGLSSVEDHGRVAFKEYFGGLPFANEESLVPALKSIILEKRIDFLIPAMDKVGYLLKKHEEDLACEVVYPRLEIAQILNRKSSTYNFLKEIIAVPKVYNNPKEISAEFPVFIKPDIGYGSRGARKITSIEELGEINGLFKEILVLEYLPGEEYTIDCFSNLNGGLIFSGVRRRKRIRMGISVATETVMQDLPFKTFASKLANYLRITGLWFFQLKEDNKGNLKLLEIAGRVSGSMALYRGLGVNFIASDLFQRLGENISFSTYQKMNAELERSFDCKLLLNLDFTAIYCDLDDCLIINEKVNKTLISFLYENLNLGKKLILITRHANDLTATLKKYRIESLFDKIYHLKDKSKTKSSAIKSYGVKGIFIDDSYNERKKVFLECDIPVFAPDSIDMLISK